MESGAQPVRVYGIAKSQTRTERLMLSYLFMELLGGIVYFLSSVITRKCTHTKFSERD